MERDEFLEMNFYRNIVVLAFGHACFISMAAALVAFAPLVAESMTGRAALTTLPFSVLTLVQLGLSFWASKLMFRIGRRRGFLLGAGLGVVGGVFMALALVQGMFSALLLGFAFCGASAAFAIYYRFAAVEAAPERLHNRRYLVGACRGGGGGGHWSAAGPERALFDGGGVCRVGSGHHRDLGGGLRGDAVLEASGGSQGRGRGARGRESGGGQPGAPEKARGTRRPFARRPRSFRARCRGGYFFLPRFWGPSLTG